MDYDREIALVAERIDSAGGERHSILAWDDSLSFAGRNEAEFAILVSDAYQNQGLGEELLRRGIHVARDEKLSRVVSEMLTDLVMQAISKKLGFRLQSRLDSSSVRAILDL